MNNKDTKNNLWYLYLAITLLIGIVMGVFVALVSTSNAKNEVKQKMTTALEYIKKQSMVYKDFAAEEISDSLSDISDRAFSVRSVIDYSADNLGDELESLAIENRLSGITVTETVENSPAWNTIYEYCDADSVTVDWSHVFELYSSVSDNVFKCYVERLTIGEYYYDYALVARGDCNGSVLCYRRKLISDIDDNKFSVSTLLNDYIFTTGGVIVVTDGKSVIGANAQATPGQLVTDTAVIRNFDGENDNELVRVKDGDFFYVMRTKCKDLYIYAYMSDANVFSKRVSTLFTAYAIYLFIVILIAIVQVIVENLKRKEQKAIEEKHRLEIEQFAEQAIHANEVKTEFLRRMSHDLRTPLNGIRGMVKIGDHYFDDMEKQKECRQKIWDASEYLLDLVNDVLYMNKLFISEPEWKEEEFSLGELLAEIDNFIVNQANEAGVEYIEATEKFEHDYIFGGKTQLKRVLVNLISNAVKYNKQNGRVNVYARETSFKDGVATFEFGCKDTGIGMSEEFTAKMFEPFERENNEISEKLEGVGLGLSIVKKIVTKAGWGLTCESKKGEGTSFTLTATFKVARGVVVDEEKGSDENDKRLAGKTILVAEDNDLNYEIVGFILGVAGASVVRARDGEEAVEMFEKSKSGEIGAILMDVMMPRMDGLVATRIIRGLNRSDAKDIPIVAMSASAFDDDIRKSKEAGMNGHITKPIDNAKLIDCLVTLLAKKGE